MLNPSLAMVSFVAPWMAWGAAVAVGLPLLAHLLSRTRYREVVFPAARLVKQAVAATSRIESPRHRLLMLMRWLLLLLLVIAFMRPQWTPVAEARETDQGIALVLLIDASASMQRTEDGVTLYERALREAQRLIDQLDPERDTAAVIRVDHAPASLLPQSTARFSLLAEHLEATEPGYTHAGWPAAITAIQRLTLEERRTIRIVTVSDQQGETPAFDDLLASSPNAWVDHVRIDGPTDNTAVRIVDVRPYPAIAGQPVTVTAELQHYGDTPEQTSLIAWTKSREARQTITLAPGEVRRPTFELPPTAGEYKIIQVAIEPREMLDFDDLTGIVLPVQTSSDVLIIHDSDPDSQQLASRLALLLNPGQIEGLTLPDVETLATDQAQTDLRDLDPATLRTIVLLNQQPLSDEASQAIEAYAQSGGGVMQFVMDASTVATRTSRAVAIDFALEALQLFEGPARAGLAELAWPGVSNSGIDPRATPILMDEMDRVIVAEMPRGRGRLIAINTVLSNEPGGLFAEPAFVVLFNELCRYASPGLALPAPTQPGDPFPASLREAMREAGPSQMPAGIDIDSNVFTVPGPHTGFESDAANESVYVTIDPAESDTSATPAWSTAQATSGATSATSAPSGTTDLRNDPIELWPYFVLGVLALLAAESLLLWRFAGPTRPVPQGGAA